MSSQRNWSGSLYYTGLLFSLVLGLFAYAFLADVAAARHPLAVLAAFVLTVLLAGTTAVTMLGATGLDK